MPCTQYAVHKPEASYHKGSLYALLLSVVMQPRAVHDTNSSGTLGKLLLHDCLSSRQMEVLT